MCIRFSLSHYDCQDLAIVMDALPFCKWSCELLAPKPPGYPESLITLGDHVRARRMDLGLEQQDVAKIIGVTESSIWNWESNSNQPRKPWMIAEIIKFLGYCPLPPPTTPGEAIRYTRTIRGLNFKEAAADIGVDPTTLLIWERDEGRPNDPRCHGKLQKWLKANADLLQSFSQKGVLVA
jgi:transcriptional regulator with XRE-family HTH domain